MPEGTPLRPGDSVIIEVDDGELLRAAALAYVPPLAGLLAGPVAVAVMPGRKDRSSLLTRRSVVKVSPDTASG